MNYLLDTCLISEFMNKRPNEGVTRWFALQEEESLYISVISIGELRKGVTKLPISKRRNELEVWLDQLVDRYGVRVLPFTLTTANLWGVTKAELEKQGRPLPVLDSLMAASALEHALTLVTRNIDDFAPTGVKLRDPWTQE
jgi:predicted nucleic acid-binding protein